MLDYSLWENLMRHKKRGVIRFGFFRGGSQKGGTAICCTPNQTNKYGTRLRFIWVQVSKKMPRAPSAFPIKRAPRYKPSHS